MKTTTYKPLKNNFTSESKTIIVLVAILLTAFFSSCSEDGSEGPVGAAGKDGTNGVNGTVGTPGATGATGATGETGTANVFFSDWAITGTVKSEALDIAPGSTFIISAPKITQDILDKGVVLVYVQAPSGGDFKSVPLPLTESTSSQVIIHNFWPGLGQIKIYKFYQDGSVPSPIGSLLKWRYILIPGGVSATGKTVKLDYYKMSYEEVCTHFNIQP